MVRLAKILQEPSATLYPVPAALVSSAAPGYRPNIITLAWVGVVASAPPQIGISIRPSRHSHALIAESGEFVVNIPTEGELGATDYCGSVSGCQVDKFAACGFTAVAASKLAHAPLIAECPVNIECQVTKSLDLGSHTLFIGQVVAVHVEEALLDQEGRIDHLRAKPFAYAQGKYYSLDRFLGRHGFSVAR